MLDFVVVIPARYESTRLPGKPLIDLEGKSLILRTYEQCMKAVDSSLIYVATDNELIKSHCESFKIKVIMTSANCLTGTDRVAEFAKHIIAKTYINVQGDEPLINPEDITKVIDFAKRFPEKIINGYTRITSNEEYINRSIPKLVFRPDGRLLYISRSPIPGNKNNEFKKSWRQICVYAFPQKSLQHFASLNSKTILENDEDIEILRFLELGYEVRVIELSSNSIAVDTPEDANRVKEFLKNQCK